jgi:hypothetical protein
MTEYLSPSVLPFLGILLAGLPVPKPPKLTAKELVRAVELLGKGWTLIEAYQQIEQARPTLPFDSPIVEVVITPDPTATGPVVDVALEPRLTITDHGETAIVSGDAQLRLYLAEKKLKGAA